MAARFEQRAAPARSASTAVAVGARTASRLDFVGDLDAAIALVAIPADGARAMLPPGLRLAAQSVSAGDRHPLLLMLGRQRNVRLDLVSAGIDYLEAVVAVPFVEHDQPDPRPRGPFAYLPRLFLDRRLPIVAGRLLLAYDKRRAVIAASDEAYRIACPRTGQLLLSARIRKAGAPSGGGLSVPMAEVLQLPVISRRARGWRYTVADLRLDQAWIEPLAMDLAIERAFLPGLPAGQFALDADGGQALRLRTSWRLTGPFARRSPRR